MQQFQKGFNYLILRGQYFEGLLILVSLEGYVKHLILFKLKLCLL